MTAMSRDHERLIELLMILLVVLLLSLARPDVDPRNRDHGPEKSSSPALWLISRIPCAMESGGFALPKRILAR